MLNRKIPYGEVFGMPGVKYEQNGKSYDSRGNEIGTKTVEVLVEKGQVEQVQVAVKLESDEESKESPVETEDGIPVIPDFEQPEIRKRPAVMTVAEMKAELDHPRHPERDDVVAGDQHRIRVEHLVVRGVLGPPER